MLNEAIRRALDGSRPWPPGVPLLAFLGAGKDKSGQIAKEVIDSIKLKTEKNDVSIRLHISDAQIDKARKKDR